MAPCSGPPSSNLTLSRISTPSTGTRTSDRQIGCCRPVERNLTSSLTTITKPSPILTPHHSFPAPKFRGHLLQQLVTALPLPLQRRTQEQASRSGYGQIRRDRTRKGPAAQINYLARRLLHLLSFRSRGLEQGFDLTEELYKLQSVYHDVGQTRIALHLQPAALEILTREEEHAIFYLIREGLRYRVCHAGATSVSVSIRLRRQKLQLHIADNGRLASSGRKPGWMNNFVHLLGYRARLLKGTIRLQTSQGGRARMTVECPLEPTLTVV